MPYIVRMNAAEFVEPALAEAAGARATAERPLAWIALEANRTMHHHELTVQYWSGGEQRLQLGVAHAHGAWLEYFAEPLPSLWPD